MTAQSFDYLYSETVPEDVLEIMGPAPKRWGRMDRISKLAVVEVGRVLRRVDFLNTDNKIRENIFVGLIAGTRRGCLTTDLAYAESLAKGLEMASPLLFSYTLANIALAEAAGHYGITGPVFALYAENPLKDSVADAKRWLASAKGLDAVIAGEIDYYEGESDAGPVIAGRFEIISG